MDTPGAKTDTDPETALDSHCRPECDYHPSEVRACADCIEKDRQRIQLLESKHELHRKLAVANLELSADALKAVGRLSQFTIATAVLIEHYENGTVTKNEKSVYAGVIKDILVGKS